MAYTWFNPPPTDDAGNPIAGTTSQPVATPASTIPNYIDPTQTDPNALAAQLINSQFQEWQSQFMPIELQQMQQVSLVNPQVLTQAVSTAQQNATGTSQAMGGILQRRNQAAGLSQTPQQQATSNRMLNVQGSLNIAGAENQARATQRQLDEQILMGSAPNPNIVGASFNTTVK